LKKFNVMFYNNLNHIFRCLLLISTGFLFLSETKAQDCTEVGFTFEQKDNFFTFTGQSKDPASEWYWYFGDNEVDKGQVVKHQFKINGEYNVCLKVLVSATCVGSVCKKIKVENAVSDCNLQSAFEYKLDGNTGIFTAKSNDDKAKYFWSVSGQNINYEGQITRIPFIEGRTYEVCLITVNGTETCKIQTCKKVEIGKSCDPEADFTFTTERNIVKFLAKSGMGNAVKYYWSFGDGTSGDGSETKHQYVKPGNYEVCLKVIGPAISNTNPGCITTICKKVSINSKSACDTKADFTFIIESNVVKVVAKSGFGNAAKYYWSFGDGTSGEGSETKHQYDKSGDYQICLKVVGLAISTTSDRNCITTICKKISVNSNPACDVRADFTYTIERDVIKFMAKSGFGNAAKYYWSFGDGTSGDGSETKHQFVKPGDYEVCLKIIGPSTASNTNPACITTICKKISVNTKNACELNADFTYKMDGKTVSFTARSNDENAAYYWFARELNLELKGKDVRFQFDKEGSYEICLIVVNGYETCKTQVCKKVAVGSRVLVYPNPATDVINITSDQKILKASIYNQLNELMRSAILDETYGTINIESLPEGMYLLSLEMEDGYPSSQRFYKK